MQKGKLKKRKINDKYSVPKEFVYDEKYKNVECEYELQGGVVTQLVIIADGQRIVVEKDVGIIAKKEERKIAENTQPIRYEAPRGRQVENFYLVLNKPIPSRKIFEKEVGKERIRVTFIDNGLFINDINDINDNIKDLKMKKYSIREKGRETEYSRKEDIERFNFEGIAFEKLHNRQREIANTFVAYKVIDSLTITDKLAIGLGSSSIYETGINLHHIYGIPYLPASSVKGIIRSWVITNVFRSEKEALEDKAFCDIFGCNGEAKVAIGNEKITCKSHYKLNPSFKGDLGDRIGSIVFLDAFPKEKPNIKVDVMTPHYGDWYDKGVAPVDTMMPVPIPFLVLKDTNFNFYFGLKNEYKENIGFNEQNKEPILDLVANWLTKALSEHGIGAKTAVGYGYMNEIKK